ncbi:MAG: C39 family peptidase [Eubacteriales bacterium]|nr:C39 family peptidase [Eubacteriales bacterium]
MKKRFTQIGKAFLIAAFLLCFLVWPAEAKEVKGKVIHGVPNFSQLPELPTGCEVTSMSMLAHYHGLFHDKMAMANFLPKGPKPYYKNGEYYGADPRIVFVGTPEDSSSFGVYHQPVMEVMDNLFPYRAKNLSGKSLYTLLHYVKDGLPVLVWTTFPTRDGKLMLKKEVREWKLEDGRRFEWIRNEHVMVLIGFTSDYKDVILNDPYTGKQQKYPYEMFEKSYELMGRQAVTVLQEKQKGGQEAGIRGKESAGKESLQPKKGLEKKAVFQEAEIMFQGKNPFSKTYRIDSELYVPLEEYAEALAGKENQFIALYREKALYLQIGKKHESEQKKAKNKIDKADKKAYLLDATFYAGKKKTDYPIYRIEGEDYLSLKKISQLLGIQIIPSGNGKALEMRSIFY